MTRRERIGITMIVGAGAVVIIGSLVATFITEGPLAGTAATILTTIVVAGFYLLASDE